MQPCACLPYHTFADLFKHSKLFQIFHHDDNKSTKTIRAEITKMPDNVARNNPCAYNPYPSSLNSNNLKPLLNPCNGQIFKYFLKHSFSWRSKFFSHWISSVNYQPD